MCIVVGVMTVVARLTAPSLGSWRGLVVSSAVGVVEGTAPAGPGRGCGVQECSGGFSVCVGRRLVGRGTPGRPRRRPGVRRRPRRRRAASPPRGWVPTPADAHWPPTVTTRSGRRRRATAPTAVATAARTRTGCSSSLWVTLGVGVPPAGVVQVREVGTDDGGRPGAEPCGL